MESRGYEDILSTGDIYRKILRLDLARDRCEVLKTDPESWRPEEELLSVQLERFAMSGAVHEEDTERFVAFTRLEQLRSCVQAGEEGANLLYRRQMGDDYRWNLMEVIPGQAGGEQFAILCVKDVHDAMRESLEGDGEGSGRRELIRSLEDRAYIINSLSRLFFSTYYLDLEQDTFRAVTELRRVGDVLGNEVNCSAALQVYANHFIHPEDREEYLNTMNVQNLRQKLRWWQPCVAVEYRRLTDEPGSGQGAWSWVRATAVLARTAGDEAPKTAVYVAQDISSGTRRPGQINREETYG